MSENSGNDDGRIDTTSGVATTAVSAANDTLHVCSPGNGQACTSCALGSALQSINSPRTTGQDQGSSVTPIRSVGFQVSVSVLRISRTPGMTTPSHNDFIHFCVNIQPRLTSPTPTVSLHALQQTFARLLGPFSYSIHQNDTDPPLRLILPAHPLRVSVGHREHRDNEDRVQLLTGWETREGETTHSVAESVSDVSSINPDEQISPPAFASVGCVLCLTEVSDEATSLPCGHVFHSSCVEEWLESFTNCPVCHASADTTPDQPRRITSQPWTSNLMTAVNLELNSPAFEALSDIFNASNSDWYSAAGGGDDESEDMDGEAGAEGPGF